MRRFLAALSTVAGAVALVVATMRPWLGERTAVELSLPALFGGTEPAGGPGVLASVAVPLIAGALLAVLGMLVRRKALLALAFLAGLVPVAGWLWRLAGDEGARATMGAGFPYAAGAVVALLLAALLLPGGTADSGTESASKPRKGRFGTA